MSGLYRCPFCGGSSGYTLREGSTYRWVFLGCLGCEQSTGEVRANVDHDKEWNEAGKHAQALRNGNTALLEALMGMCLQYLTTRGDDSLWHDHMAAGEHAMSVRLEAGMIQVKEGEYFLDWDALDRRQAVI